MPSWVNRTVLSGSSVNENGTTSHTCTFNAASSGNFLVAVVGGSVTFTTPSGWTLATSAVNNAAVYVFTKVASSGESSFTTTHSVANFAIQGVVYEFPAGTTYQAGNSAFGMTGTATGPTVSGLTGTYARFCARVWCMSQPTSTSTTEWTLPTILDHDSYVPQVTNDGVALSIAYDDNQTAASFTPDSTTTNMNTAPAFGEGVAFAIATAPSSSGMYLSNNANGGVNGANVTYYNSGEISGDPWDYMSISSGAAITYSNQNARGGMSYQFSTGGTAGQTFFEWQKFATPFSPLYVRFNVFLPVYPSSSTRFCEITDGTSLMISIGIRNDGTISVRDSPGNQMVLTTTSLPRGRWSRVEFRAISSATTGQITLKTYREVDSPYPTETISSTATFNTQPASSMFTKIRFGITGINIANTTYYLDDIAISSAGYLGPANATANSSLLIRNGAEMGANGTTISTTNSGDKVNAAVDIIRGPDPITFSNTQSAHGSLSYRFQPTAGEENFLIWARMATSAAATRAYFYFTALPGSLNDIMQLTTNDIAFNALARMVLTPTGNLRVLDLSGSSLWTSASPISANTWYRIEMYAALGGTATTGTITAAYYALDSTTAIESFTTSVANLGTTQMNYLRIGKVASASAWNTAFYIDDIAMQQKASGFIGPYTSPPPTPVSYGGATPPVGWGVPAQVSKIYPVPIFSDTFTGSDGSAWDGSKWVAVSNPVTGGGATIQTNSGRLQSGTTGSYSPNDRIMRRINIGQVADFDMTCTFSYDATEAFGSFVYRSYRADLEVENSYAFEFNRTGTVQIVKYIAFANSTVGTATFTVANSTLYKTRIRVVGNSHNIKVWAASASEPTSWNITATDSSHMAAGTMGFACAGGGTAGVAGNFYIDDVTLIDP